MKNNESTYNGIVLSTKDFKESAKIITIITNNGLKTFILYGYKSKKKDYKAIFQPITEIEIRSSIYKNQDKIVAYKLHNEYKSIKLNYKQTFMVLELFKIIVKLPYFDSESNFIFLLIKKLLVFLDKNRHFTLLEILAMYFYYNLAYCFGIKINTSNYCYNCNKLYDKLNFDYDKGSFICPDCTNIKNVQVKTHITPISNELRKYMITFNQSKYDDLININLSPSLKLKTEYKILIMNYFEYHLNLKNINFTI